MGNDYADLKRVAVAYALPYALESLIQEPCNKAPVAVIISKAEKKRLSKEEERRLGLFSFVLRALGVIEYESRRD